MRCQIQSHLVQGFSNAMARRTITAREDDDLQLTDKHVDLDDLARGELDALWDDLLDVICDDANIVLGQGFEVAASHRKVGDHVFLQSLVSQLRLHLVDGVLLGFGLLLAIRDDLQSSISSAFTNFRTTILYRGFWGERTNRNRVFSSPSICLRYARYFSGFRRHSSFCSSETTVGEECISHCFSLVATR